MRLINVSNLKLEEFEVNPPPYAMLSHRWGDEEVSLRDFCDKKSRRIKKGFAKIRGLCDLVVKEYSDLQHAWVDTCCIDKTSSAELSEAINSMFSWYSAAEVCIVYLSDVAKADELSTSAWFTRGWTLQELLAPKHVEFYDGAWNSMGNKIELLEELIKITKINGNALQDLRPLSLYSICERMSWAAHRSTSRIEDMAYSLLGIFDINMPLIYGEGQKAFIRLQEEIIKQTDDRSIFAWDLNHDILDWDKKYYGLLAPTVRAFAGPIQYVDIAHVLHNYCSMNPEEPTWSWDFMSWPSSLGTGKSHHMTSGGMSIELFLFPWSLEVYAAVLECTDEPRRFSVPCIFLRRLFDLHSPVGKNQFARVSPPGRKSLSLTNDGYTPFYLAGLRPAELEYAIDGMVRQNIVRKYSEATVVTLSIREFLVDSTSRCSNYRYVYRQNQLSLPFGYDMQQCDIDFTDAEYLSVVRIIKSHDVVGAIRFGFNFDFLPVCILCTYQHGKSSGARTSEEEVRHHLCDLWRKFANRPKLPTDQTNKNVDEGYIQYSIIGWNELAGIRGCAYYSLRGMHVVLRRNKAYSPQRWVVDIGMVAKTVQEDVHFVKFGSSSPGHRQHVLERKRRRSQDDPGW